MKRIIILLVLLATACGTSVKGTVVKARASGRWCEVTLKHGVFESNFLTPADVCWQVYPGDHCELHKYDDEQIWSARCG